MLESGHCTVHPSREAHLRCRSCGGWLCDRCATSTRTGVFCSRSCRIRASWHALGAWARSLATNPLEPQWTTAVTAALGALLLGAIGLLLSELGAVNRTNHLADAAIDAHAVHAARLVETERGREVEVLGSPGARVLVVDRSGRSIEMTLDRTGRGREPAEGLDAVTVWVEGLELETAPPPQRTAPNTPSPAPSPTRTPTPVTPAATPTLAVTPSIRIDPALIVPNPTPAPRSMTAARSLPAQRPAGGTSGAASAPIPPILHLVPDAGPRIAITFDGGASSNRTAELLDLLQELDIEATLFLTGGFIRAQPALVRRAVLSGHEVGNHTDSHLHLTSYASDRRHDTLPEVTRDRLLTELRRTEEAFQRATGRTMAPLWRAPYGEENATLRRWAFEAGYLHVRWSSLEGRSLDTMDWIEDEHSPYFRDSRRIMDRLLRFPRLRGGIILMHLATAREEPPWTHLPEFVAALRERSIEPVKITTLLSASRSWRGWLEKAAQRHAQATGTAPEPDR